MLRDSLKKYIFRLLVFSICMTSLTYLMQFLFPDYASPALPYIVFFFFAIMLFSHYIILRGIYKEGKRFESNYMLATLFKFLAYLIFLLVYILTHRSDALLFGIAFIVIYFAFTTFEVIAVKRENK